MGGKPQESKPVDVEPVEKPKKSFDRATIYDAKVKSGDDHSGIYEILDDTDTFISKLTDNDVPYFIVTPESSKEGFKFIESIGGIKKVLNIVPIDGKFGVKTILIKKPIVDVTFAESVMVKIANKYIY